MNGLASLGQGFKPVLVQALVPEGAVETLHICVLRRPARLDQDVFDAVLLCPGHEGPASEFWPVVCPDCLWVASELRCPVQNAGDVMAAQAEVHRYVHAFVAEVVRHRQAFDTPGNRARPGNGITDKVHAPGLVHRRGGHQWHTHTCALGLFAFPDGQALLAVQPVNALVVDARVFGTQRVMDHAVTPAPALMRGLHDLLAQLLVQGAGCAGVAVTVSA